MYIKKLAPETMLDDYDILCEYVYPWKDVVKPPFGMMWGLVKPGQTSRAHNHFEGETFVIVKGSGSLTCGAETATVSAGDVIYLPPCDSHSLHNDQPEDLLFLTCYWGDEKLLNQAEEQQKTQAPAFSVITATPPTPNGDLHVGHLSGPYLRADIYKRLLDLKGRANYYVSGIDAHQSYVMPVADRLGKTVAQTALDFGQAMLDTLHANAVYPDRWLNTYTDKAHQTWVADIFSSLYREGKLVEKEVSAPFHPETGRYLYEVFIAGDCPNCGAGSCGNACEVCGEPNDCSDLQNAVCNQDGQTPVFKTIKKLYFPLSQYEAQLREFFGKVNMNAHMREMCQRMLDKGLPDVCLSHQTEWGLPVPVPGYEDQRIYVWFEMAPSYIESVRQLQASAGAGDEPLLWNRPDTEIVQFFGFDNGYFHAVLFPALLMAYDPDLRLPDTFVVNEFYRLDGLKFSTSRNHVIWGKELLDAFPRDLVRFYLSYSGPDCEQTNFTREEMTATLAREIDGLWRPWLTDLKAKMDAGDGAPEPGAWSAEHTRFYQSLRRLGEDFQDALNPKYFSTRAAARVLCDLVTRADHFAKSEAFLSLRENLAGYQRTSLALQVLAAKQLAVLCAPIMPDFAARLWADLGFKGAPTWEDTPRFLEAGQKVVLADDYLVYQS